MALSSRSDTAIDAHLRSLDTKLEQAGATRTPRGRSKGESRRDPEPERTLEIELAAGSALRVESQIAENGVC